MPNSVEEYRTKLSDFHKKAPSLTEFWKDLIINRDVLLNGLIQKFIFLKICLLFSKVALFLLQKLVLLGLLYKDIKQF